MFRPWVARNLENNAACTYIVTRTSVHCPPIQEETSKKSLSLTAAAESAPPERNIILANRHCHLIKPWLLHFVPLYQFTVQYAGV